MTGSIYTSLSWLPPLEIDPKSAMRDLGACDADFGDGARRLARHGLDFLTLDRLGRKLAARIKAGADLRPLAPIRMALIGTGMLDLLAPSLVATAARHGFALDCRVGSYGQALHEALAPNSLLNTTPVDIVLIAMDHRSLPIDWCPAHAEAATDAVRSAGNLIHAMVTSLKKHSGATCIIQTFAPPPETLFGSLDRRVAGTPRSLLHALNERIAEIATSTDSLLLDVDALVAVVGSADWYSPSEWNAAKLPFSSTYIPVYAEHVARLLGSLRGRSRKCLVLDLDNTLWGGVIGDDGVEGIRLAQGDPEGEGYLELQRYALHLRSRGVVLAVCSKNSDDVARQPFRQHPDMLLKEEHISVFQANWKDKASNIRAIAAALDFSLDALVFVDDNPVERDLVRRELPDVAVVELPEDPAFYARTLSASGYFEATTFSKEDAARADAYAGNARRLALRDESTDLDGYLRSLAMEITFSSFDEVGRSRVAQLVNKSNQFNLTTRRYTTAEIAELADDPDVFTLQIRLIDRFGDNGMISVVICEAPRGGEEWVIDSWLMSCRVLGRRVEHAVLAEIVRNARHAGATSLVGNYVPTSKNALVRDHFETLGFQLEGIEGDGRSSWRIALDHLPDEPSFKITRPARRAPPFESRLEECGAIEPAIA